MIIIKQKTELRYVYKINLARFKRSNWNLTLDAEEAFQNGELITIAENQLIRFIESIRKDENETNKEKQKELLRDIKESKRSYKKNPSKDALHIIKDKTYSLWENSLVKEYLCVVVDKVGGFKYACSKGITFNGRLYKRLVGTSSGVKNSTVVFVPVDILRILNKKIDNGRNKKELLVPAKLEAYRALICSGSVPVSDPKGIVVVKDCITHFKSDVIHIDDEGDEPVIEKRFGYDIDLNNSDGYGLILPSLSERWTHELGGTGTTSGFCIRNSFCKGMVFTFDFHEFAKEIANNYKIIDVWGQEQDIRQAEMILTESMLKLWNCYKSLDEYLRNCKKNGYTYCISKTTPPSLESERQMNYQFLQDYDLTENEIDELIEPTVSNFLDILGGDYRKSILYLLGDEVINGFNGTNIDYISKALMICPDVYNDPYIKTTVQNMVSKAINQSKLGKINVHGNYSLVAGDCFALCESMFNIKPKGLLKEGEAYNQYWADAGVDEVVCFRPPMTSKHNIRKLKIVCNKEIDRWFKYMPTATIFNAWDTAAFACNGLDFDGDQVLITDNQILLKNTELLPSIICEQKKADKKRVTKKDLIKANIKGFKSKIGFITNIITAMVDKQSLYKPESDEWKELEKRILCGQLFQQNEIDSLKGVITKPMPKYWYSKVRVSNPSNDKTKDENIFIDKQLDIVVDKQPYFMRFRYPSLNKQYKDYVRSVESNCCMRFGISLNEIIKQGGRTDEEVAFINIYNKKLPVINGNGIINRICNRIENLFDNIPLQSKGDSYYFDYSLYKSSVKYNPSLVVKIEKMQKVYMKMAQDLVIEDNTYHLETEDRKLQYDLLRYKYAVECEQLCSDRKELCNLLLDTCYKSKNSKKFVWDICGDVIVENLMEKYNHSYTIPQEDENGDIIFKGKKYKMVIARSECE